MNSDYFVIEEIEKNTEVLSNKPELIEEETTSSTDFQEVQSPKQLKLAKCPSCGSKTLKVEGGCHSCINKDCGYSKCDM